MHSNCWVGPVGFDLSGYDILESTGDADMETQIYKKLKLGCCSPCVVVASQFPPGSLILYG